MTQKMHQFLNIVAADIHGKIIRPANLSVVTVAAMTVVHMTVLMTADQALAEVHILVRNIKSLLTNTIMTLVTM